MKFLSLRLHNFKPYYDSPTEKQVCILYNENRPKKNICINVGPTGNGKTSISEAIKWCLFGDITNPNWEEWINDLSIEVANAKNDDSCKISVELQIECEGEKYNLIRSGIYNHKENIKNSQSELDIIKDGEPINNPDEFINKHFLPLDLMDYYVFDADDILSLFEKDRRKTIRDHINRIVGVEILDDMTDTFKSIESEYKKDRERIFIESDDELGTQLTEKINQIAIKNEAINTISAEINNMKKRQEGLFKNVPPDQIKTFTGLCNNREYLKKELENLDKEFNNFIYDGFPIISNFDLIIIKDTLKNAINKISEQEVSKTDFTTSVDIIKSVISDKYKGIFFNDKDGLSLIKNSIKIDYDKLDEVENLNLSTESSGTRTDSLAEFNKFHEIGENLLLNFSDYKKKFKKIQGDLFLVQNKLELMGETEENKELKNKYEEYVKLDRGIKENREGISEIRQILNKLKEEKEKINKNIELNNETKEEKNMIEKKIELVLDFYNIIKESKKDFLKDLLDTVNIEASNFLRNVTKDKLRYHSVEIDHDYDFNVKTKQGNILKDSQMNRGNLQIAMMSFFFALSKYLPKKIPYVIDDPLIRLDIGHERRLIEELSKTNEQIILHMIPIREYSAESYKWIQPFLNHQNWIDRKKHRNIDIEYSYIESKEPDKLIKFNVDEL